MLKKIFNLNTGYFVNNVTFDYEGKPTLGFELCRGYIMFGVYGYDKLIICSDIENLFLWLKIYKITNFTISEDNKVKLF